MGAMDHGRQRQVTSADGLDDISAGESLFPHKALGPPIGDDAVKVGGTIEIEIERMGVLGNRVV